MATQTYDTENAKLMRPAAKVGIRVYVGTTLVLDFDNSNLLSVSLTLRGVETKVDNPELQASDIEIQAYYTGDLATLLQFRGKTTRIQYKSSYGSTLWTNDVASQYVGVRVFYTSFDKDHISLKDNILTIKGTDFTGTLSKEIWSLEYLVPSWPVYTYSGTSYYRLTDMWSSYLNFILPTSRMPGLGPNPYGGNFYFTKGLNDYVYAWVAPRMSWRKRIAQIVNAFRGSTSEVIIPRALYVDAGCPHFAWLDGPLNSGAVSSRVINNQNYNISNGKYNNVWYSNTWEIDYANVADFEIEYGNAISKIYVDTPYARKRSLTQTITMQPNMSDIVTLDHEGIFRRISVTASGTGSTIPSTFSLTQLDEKTAVVKCGSFTGTCYGTIAYDTWDAVYNRSGVTTIPDIAITTPYTNGDEVTLEQLPFLRLIHGKYVPTTGSAVDYNYYYHGLGIEKAMNECNIAQPRWIKFKWRGHPGMQPRDIILFTEKDGTKNYYEVDYLTLEHKDGGLVSEVKAMYKMPYSS